MSLTMGTHHDQQRTAKRMEFPSGTRLNRSGIKCMT